MKIDGKEVLADLRKHVKLEVDLDGFALSQMDKIVIPLTDSLLAKVAKLIPGSIDDAIITTLKPQIYAELKEEIAKALVKVEGKLDEVLEGKADEAQA